MTSQQIQRLIVIELRNGPLDQFQIAAGIGQAPFRVRAELRHLKRDRLVRDYINGGRLDWELTAKGLREAFAVDHQQMRML